jgi:DNA-binding HxlR family transcriptional regulator
MSSDTLPICAAEVIFRVVRGRWALSLVVVIAEQGPIHFLAISRSLPGISRKVLTDQLRFLERAGVVSRSTVEKPPQVFYELTTRGLALKKAIDGLNELAARWPDI